MWRTCWIDLACLTCQAAYLRFSMQGHGQHTYAFRTCQAECADRVHFLRAGPRTAHACIPQMPS